MQVYSLLVSTVLTGDSYVSVFEAGGYESYLVDPLTRVLREGALLVYAPDAAQGFPASAGPDGTYFTADDPAVGLPAGYTLATLDADGTVSFARPIGVGAGLNFDAGSLAPEMKQAIEHGIADAWADFAAGLTLVKEGKLTSGDIFGTREFLKNNYRYRMLGAALGIYGNSQAEAIYPTYYVDEDGQPPNGAQCCTLRFGPGQLPPVNTFWSLTMYEEPVKLLVANPLNRYLLNSTMLAQFKQDADGGLTLLIQHESPGSENEANWLPAPKGPFSMIMRLYWPGAAALDGSWKAPPLKRI